MDISLEGNVLCIVLLILVAAGLVSAFIQIDHRTRMELKNCGWSFKQLGHVHFLFGITSKRLNAHCKLET